MTMPLPSFKTGARAVIIGIAFGAASLGALPVQAQSFGFSLDLPSFDGNERGRSVERNSGGFGDDHERMQRSGCLTDRELQRGVEAQGYSGVEIGGELGNGHVDVAGQNGNWLYSMRVDRCTGEVDRVQRSRRVHGGGFGLQFNLGN
ncbi:hypothetical protein [uncultured Devosia sp.]|uniref:hypothetical protein n=1 Tax=uncultured Devosia sp. TaxID=211434 RepID=UPI0035CB6B02